MNHIATVEPSAPRENYPLLIMGVSNGDGDGGEFDGDGSGGNSPSRQGAGTETSVPRTRVDDDGRDGTFRGLMLIDLGFSRDGEDIGRRARSVGGLVGHTTLGAVPGLAVPRHGVATLWPHFVSPSDSVFVS